MEYLYFTLQILLAIVLGGVLGWQREKIGKPAGPRTYALVAAGSALFTLLSLSAFGTVNTVQVAAQIVTGVGFLGAGIIIHRDGGIVEGLTTAAGFWAAAAIGMAVGAGWLIQAGIATLLLLIILSIDDHKFLRKKKR
ncbi:MAG: MgtC/SapB family protein [Candidatus Magasanikiibacteriota bacterium]